MEFRIPTNFSRDIKFFHINYEYCNAWFVKGDDRVYALGLNDMGNKLGFGHSYRVNTPEEVIELSNKRLLKFYDGEFFGMALGEGDRLLSWRTNLYGELGRIIVDENDGLTPKEIIISLRCVVRKNSNFWFNNYCVVKKWQTVRLGCQSFRKSFSGQ